MALKFAKNKYGIPLNYKGKIPARCSHCRTRRTLSKFPEDYVYWPVCQVPGCKCLNAQGDLVRSPMTVDVYRLKARYLHRQKIRSDLYYKDVGEQCTCSGHPRMHPKGKVTDLYACIHPKPEKKINFNFKNKRFDNKAGAVPF